MSFVSIKVMTGNNDPLVIMVYSCVLGVIFTAAPAAWLWQTPSLREALILFGLGGASLAAFGCMLRALSLRGAAALMPLDYVRLPLATALGYALFSEAPTSTAILGAGLILLAALTTFAAERAIIRRTVQPE